MSTFDDDALARVLASVGRHLETDATAVARPTTRRAVALRHPRSMAVAAAVIVVVLTVLVITPVRRAVADWLGIGSTTVVHVPAGAEPSVPTRSITTGLRPIDPDEAVRRIGRPLPDTTGTVLGAPDALAAMPEGGVLMIWTDGATTLWVHDEDMPAQILVKKLISADQDARFVSGLGDGALVITGDHVLVTPHRTIGAGTVVLWTDGTTELRLESELPVDTMTAIARQLD